MACPLGAGCRRHARRRQTPRTFGQSSDQPVLRSDELRRGRCALAQPWLRVDHGSSLLQRESRGSVFVDVYNAMTTAGGVSCHDLRPEDDGQDDQQGRRASPSTPSCSPTRRSRPFPRPGDRHAARLGLRRRSKNSPADRRPPENLKDTMKKVNGYAERTTPSSVAIPHLVTFDMEPQSVLRPRSHRAFFLTLGSA